MLGSCFAESIAQRMLAAKFPVAKNPFGAIYNPAGIARAVADLAAGRLFTPEDLDTDGELWFSYAHHGSFSSPDREAALAAINREAQKGARALREADYAILTLGTAWIYELAGRGVVANCHKQPAGRFTRRRLSVEEVTETLGGTIRSHLEGKEVILTVSPIRHPKDGLAENARSKAILIEACHRLAESHPQAEYFPAYEILLDELRDYRFYESDMLHPSPVAADYIWERFRKAAMDGPALELAREAEALTQAAAHRPLHPGTPSHARFRRSMLDRARALQERHPELCLQTEIDAFADETL